jgi:hypothetical protein
MAINHTSIVSDSWMPIHPREKDADVACWMSVGPMLSGLAPAIPKIKKKPRPKARLRSMIGGSQ